MFFDWLRFIKWPNETYFDIVRFGAKKCRSTVFDIDSRPKVEARWLPYHFSFVSQGNSVQSQDRYSLFAINPSHGKKHLLFSKSPPKKTLWSKRARMFQVTKTFGRIGFFCGNLLVTNCFFFLGVIFLSTTVCFTTFWKLNFFLFPIFVWDTNLSGHLDA